jgi:hypothetical protein
MTTLAFYRAQAAREQTQADDATLDNARHRNQRAADAWTVLAERAQRAEEGRQRHALAKTNRSDAPGESAERSFARS